MPKLVPLIHETKWQEIRNEFGLLGFDFDYSKFDEAIMIREQNESMPPYYPPGYNPPSHFDFDSFVDEHVAMEKNNGLSSF